jgi:hypothetical protein
VADRVSALRDPKVIDLIRTKFVPLAIDATNSYFYTDKADGKFLTVNLDSFVVRTADGKVLGHKGTAFTDNHGRELKEMLEEALKKFRPGKAPKLEADKSDRKVPEDVVVVNVTARLLGSPEPYTLDKLIQFVPETKKLKPQDQKAYLDYYDKWSKIFHTALGQDHLWIRKDEVQALAKGELPESLKIRIARYHLEDFARGQALYWPGKDHIKKLEMKLKRGRLTGSVHLEDRATKRGFEAELLGFIEFKGNKLTRFDLVAKGRYWGSTCLLAFAPRKKYPLAVGFSLSRDNEEAKKVPPNGLLKIAGESGYLR